MAESLDNVPEAWNARYVFGARLTRVGERGAPVMADNLAQMLGGTWRFEMRAPNGTVYPNRIDFLEIRRPELLVFDHGTDQEDDPNRFRVTVTFDTQSDGKTVLTLRQLHPSKVRRNAAIGFGAVEYGYQTLDKLAAHVRGM